MPLISLRESLSRSKEKWKKRFHIGSNHTNSVSSPTNNMLIAPDSAGSGSAPPSKPSGGIPGIFVPTQEHLTNPVTTTNNTSEKSSAAWPAIKSLLTTLESSADGFGPLRAAISGLNRCVEIYEDISKGRKEYDELRNNLEGLLNDLAEHMSHPMGLVMTNSVKRLCADLEMEVRYVEAKQARNTGRQLVNVLEASEEVLECYRRIHDYLERLIFNANMCNQKQ
ncbi:hypothetical protein ACGC1H_003873 [Rhizoctonia solani]